MTKHIITLDTACDRDVGLVGGKARSLGVLRSLGLSVPDGFVLTTIAYERYVTENGIDALIDRVMQEVDVEDLSSVERTSDAVQAAFLRGRVSNDFAAELESATHALHPTLLAVRSSATVEDSMSAAWAGQFDSFTNISAMECCGHVVRCWASLFSSRAIRYALLKDVSLSEVRMAVIVQTMLDGTVSGVVFSESPDDCDEGRLLVEGVFGLGEALVSGSLTPDTYVVDRNTLRCVRKTIVCKRHALRYDTHAGTVILATLSADEVDAPILTEAQLSDLCATTLSIERYTGVPVDVEWVLSNGTFFVVQSRPITARASLEIYDSSNIAESYAGVTTISTFSFIRYVYEGVYKEFCALLGVSQTEIQKHQSVFAHMVEYIGAHVYYNLRNWHTMISLFPGYAVSHDFMEHMMGVDQRYRGSTLPRSLSALNSLRERFGMVYRGCRVAWVFATLPYRMRRFCARFDIYEARVRNTNIEGMGEEEIMALYHTLDRDLIRSWRTPIANDFAVMVSGGIFATLAKKYRIKWSGKKKSTEQSVSVLLGQEFLTLVDRIRTDPALHSMFDSTRDATEVWEQLCALHAESPLMHAIQDYIQAHGARVPNDLKLESVTYREDPTLLIKLLQVGAAGATVMEGSGREKECAKNTMGKYVPYHIDLVYGLIHRWNRCATEWREEARIRRGRGFDLVRRIILRGGVLLYERGCVPDARDVLHLTIDELFSALRGEVGSIHVNDLVRMRKDLMMRAEKVSLPRRIETRTALSVLEERILSGVYAAPNTEVMNMGESLQGVVTSAHHTGVCTGEALVMAVFDPSKDVRGRILITKHTDPGWTLLFPLLRGIVLERGGALSHASVVARELGIPCVVGVQDATDRIRSGRIISIDTATGEVAVMSAKDV